jgi:anti-sigma regulatory factor (Ser/Thr protein kinase)
MVSETFIPRPTQVGAARHFARSVALNSGCEAGDLELVVSELATNACVHAHSPFTVSLSRTGTHWLVEVTDEDAGEVAMRPYDETTTEGRGMQIVEALTTSWGVRASPPRGKSVWAELDCWVVRTAERPQGCHGTPYSESAIP